MTDISAVEAALTNLGFKPFDEHPALAADHITSLSENGPYTVHGAWKKGDHIVHVEENVGPESFPVPDGQGGTRNVTVPDFHFPAVIVIEDTSNPLGRTAVGLHDLEAFARVAEGERDFNENGDSADPTSNKR